LYKEVPLCIFSLELYISFVDQLILWTELNLIKGEICIKQQKSFTVSDKIYILVQADAHTGTRVDLALELGHPVSTINTIVTTVKQMK
jgi:hypothetical protein